MDTEVVPDIIVCRECGQKNRFNVAQQSTAKCGRCHWLLFGDLAKEKLSIFFNSTAKTLRETKERYRRERIYAVAVGILSETEIARLRRTMGDTDGDRDTRDGVI